MIRTQLFILSLLIAVFSASAQQSNHCQTYTRIQVLKSEDASTVSKEISAEQKIQNWISNHPDFKTPTTLVVPVVVHVLYKNAAQNVADSVIQRQIDILNRDYRKLNSDTVSTPFDFKPFAADCEIEFCLAKRDPFGNVTNGITRRAVSMNEIGNTSFYYRPHYGGDTIWDRNFYLNIWVCEIEALGGTLGYSSVPSYNPPVASDGVVIDYRFFGKSSNVHYNKGRTATHEVGHWFDLQHIWGDDFGYCSGDDFVSDTPNQTLEHYGLPSFPSLDSCTPAAPGTMFMNFMDYTDDSGMNLFTKGQKQRMWAALQTTFRDSLFHSKGCVPVGIHENVLNQHLKLAPNPVNSKLLLTFKGERQEKFLIEVYSLTGSLLLSKSIPSTSEFMEWIDLSELSSGVYLLKLISESNTTTKKFMKE